MWVTIKSFASNLRRRLSAAALRILAVFVFSFGFFDKFTFPPPLYLPRLNFVWAKPHLPRCEISVSLKRPKSCLVSIIRNIDVVHKVDENKRVPDKNELLKFHIKKYIYKRNKIQMLIRTTRVFQAFDLRPYLRE